MSNSVQLGDLRIVWDEGAVEALRKAVLERFCAAAPVGEELLGILFGRREGDTLRITAWSAIARARSAAPAVPLNDDELAEARRVISVRRDGLEPIGWFRSRTRGMAALSPEDAQECGQLFPDRESLVVILRPSTQRPVTAAFFLVRPGLVLEASMRGVRVSLPGPSDTPGGEEGQSKTASNAAGKLVAARAVIRRKLRLPQTVWVLPAMAFGVGLLVTYTVCFFLLDRPVRMRAGVQGPWLVLQWNKSVGFLSGATGADLEVNSKRYQISKDTLRQGATRADVPPGDLRVYFQVRGPFSGTQKSLVTVVVSPAQTESRP